MDAGGTGGHLLDLVVTLNTVVTTSCSTTDLVVVVTTPWWQGDALTSRR